MAQETPAVLKGSPSLLEKGSYSVGLQFRGFGGADKLLYTDISAVYGLCKSTNIEFIGDFARDGNQGGIRFGGSDGELRLRYKLPTNWPATVQAGIADAATPAQGHRIAATLGASFSYAIDSRIGLYAEPRAVILDRNSLIGLGLGSLAKLATGVELVAEWTPILSGRNAIDTQSLGRRQVDLYSLGFCFTKLQPGMTIDVAYTNAAGESTGFSMTPSLGNVGGFLVGATYRF